MPPGIVFRDVDPRSGLLPTAACPDTIREAYLTGTDPQRACVTRPALLPPRRRRGLLRGAGPHLRRLDAGGAPVLRTGSAPRPRPLAVASAPFEPRDIFNPARAVRCLLSVRMSWATVGPRLPKEDRILFGVLGVTLTLWLFLAIASLMATGTTQAFDERVLGLLRRPDAPAVPIGPAWCKAMAVDLTALGSVVVLLTFILAGGRRLSGMWSASSRCWPSSRAGTARRHDPERDLEAGSSAGRVPTVVAAAGRGHSTSFPSGHSMLSAVVYLTLGALLARTGTSATPPARVYFIGVALLLTFLDRPVAHLPGRALSDRRDRRMGRRRPLGAGVRARRPGAATPERRRQARVARGPIRGHLLRCSGRSVVRRSYLCSSPLRFAARWTSRPGVNPGRSATPPPSLASRLASAPGSTRELVDSWVSLLIGARAIAVRVAFPFASRSSVTRVGGLQCAPSSWLVSKLDRRRRPIGRQRHRQIANRPPRTLRGAEAMLDERRRRDAVLDREIDEAQAIALDREAVDRVDAARSRSSARRSCAAGRGGSPASTSAARGSVHSPAACHDLEVVVAEGGHELRAPELVAHRRVIEERVRIRRPPRRGIEMLARRSSRAPGAAIGTFSQSGATKPSAANRKSACGAKKYSWP